MRKVTRGFWAAVIAVPVCAYFYDGVYASSPLAAIVAGIVLGIAYVMLRPILKLISLPLGCITFGLAGVLVDMALVYLCSVLVPGFIVDGFWWTLAVAVTVNLFCMLVGDHFRK